MTTPEPTRWEVWPRERLEPRDVEVLPICFDKSSREIYIAETWNLPTDGPRIFPLPDEFYLRELADLEVWNDKALAGFVEQYGAVYWPGSTVYGRLIGGLVIHRRAARVALSDVRDEVLVLRNLSRLVVTMMESPGGLSGESLESVSASWEPCSWDIPTNARQLATQAALRITAGLGNLSPFVSVSGTRPQNDSLIDVYSATCLQMFNHIAEGASVRRCRSQTCGRAFVRQLGRAKTMSGIEVHRMVGVDYCSKECAQAEAARQRRFRIRDAGRLHKQGMTVSRIAEQMDATPKQVQGWLAAAAKRRKGADDGQD